MNMTIPNPAKGLSTFIGTALTNVIIKRRDDLADGAVVGSVDGVEFARFDDALPQQFV